MPGTYPPASSGGSFSGYPIVVKTANYTVQTADNNTFFSNYGSAATWTLQMPNTPANGFFVGALCVMATSIGITMRAGASDKIVLPHTASAVGGAVIQTGSGRANGEDLGLVYDAGSLSWRWVMGYGFDWSAIA